MKTIYKISFFKDKICDIEKVTTHNNEIKVEKLYESEETKGKLKLEQETYLELSSYRNFNSEFVLDVVVVDKIVKHRLSNKEKILVLNYQL